MTQYTPLQLVFTDESAYDRRTRSRHYGWCFRGRRARKPVFFVRGKRYTIEGALCLNGLLAYAIQEGPMNSNDYIDFIENALVIIILYYIFLFLLYYSNKYDFYSSFLR